MYKEIILSKIIEYCKKKKYHYKKYGQVITLDCPICKGNLQARVIQHTNRIKCMNPLCGKKFGLVTMVRSHEKEYEDKSKYSIDDIIQYLKELLKVNVITKQDSKELEEWFNLYKTNGWALLPLVKGEKVPIAQRGWNTTEYKEPVDWNRWAYVDGLNLGVRTGAISNLTIIDIDCLKKEEENLYCKALQENNKEEIKKWKARIVIPEEIKNVMGDCLIQETFKGFQLCYKYVDLLPKTNFEFETCHIDVENNGGYCVVYPSIIYRDIKVKGIVTKTGVVSKRKFNKKQSPIEIPSEMLAFLQKYIKTRKPSESDRVDHDIRSDYHKALIAEGEGRNDFLLRIAGKYRKIMSLKKTEQAVRQLNEVICDPPSPSNEITAMMRSLDNYTAYDEEELAQEILNFLKNTDGCIRLEITRGLQSIQPDPKIVAEALSYLVKEEKVIKRGTFYSVQQKPEWKTTLINVCKPIDFKVPYFDDIAKFNWGDNIIIGAKTGVGKCFAKDTGILMFDGSIKKVQEIKKGDKLMGVDNTPRNVLNTCKGKELMYKIIPTKGEGFSVNESHILSLKNTTTKKIVNIELKDYLKQTKTFKHLHKLYRVPVKFPKKVTPIIDPYFLGLWLGDGDKTNTRITTKDKEIIKYLKGYSKKLKLQLSTYDYKNRCPSYAITSGKQGRNNKQYCLYKKMKDMKLLFNDKHIPFIYKVNSRKNRLSLLAGLIDSDGYITGKNKTGHEITLTNKKLAEDIVYLCRSLGFLSYIREKIATIKSINYKTKAYRISIIGDCTAIPVKLKRKKAKKRKINKDPLVTGFKVKKLKVDNYYGFFLDGDHLHLIDSFIVNHNTHIAMNIIKQLIAQGKKPRYVGREPGSRFIEIALQLGIKEEDFEYIEYCPDPTKLEFEKNDIIIIDWLLPKDYAKTDKTFDDLTLLLQKHKAFMFTFVQIRDNGNWFAPDLIEFFPALSAKYLYDDDENTLFGHFSIYKIRAGRRVTPKRNVPCRYDWETKLLVRIEDEINNKVIEKKPDEDGTGDLKDEKVVD